MNADGNYIEEEFYRNRSSLINHLIDPRTTEFYCIFNETNHPSVLDVI